MESSKAAPASAETVSKQQYSKDEIDHYYDYYNHSDSDNEQAAQLIASLKQVAITVVSTAANLLLDVVVVRTDSVISTEGERRRDGDAAPPMRSLDSCVLHLYHTCGFSGLFHGSRLRLLGTCSLYVAEVMVGVGINRALGRPRHWLSAALQSFLAAAALWPARSLFNVLSVNYLSDVANTTTAARATAAREDATAAGAAGDEASAAAIRAAAATEPEGGHAGIYRYPTYRKLWESVRSTMGWHGVLCYGWDVYLLSRSISHVAGLALSYLVPSLMKLGQQVPGDSTSLSRRAILLLLFNSPLIIMNVVHRPLIVLSRRMAVLPKSTTPRAGAAGRNAATAEGDKKSDVAYGGDAAEHGRRYCNMMDCARQMVAREGWTALFTGLKLSVAVNTVLPLTQLFIVKAVVLTTQSSGAV